MMAELYDVDVRTINEHIKKVLNDGELNENSVIRKFRITANDGKNYNTLHYNLQIIIAVGFKVQNVKAVQFRKWVGQIVKDYTIQGWTMDVDRIKKVICLLMIILTVSYNRLREIRLSERKFYQKITDI